tara:strand:- start:4440 stop:5279 length:840 start_codon:yes stop_codon:yes gene_type:complete
MSKTFKRPMFRKGGDVGGGIMNNIVERGQYADSNAKDLNLSISDKIDAVMAAGGDRKGLNDPLTQFLLQYGPSVVGQTGGGSTIGNLVLASKEPTANLIKDLQADRKTRQAIALDLFKDMDKNKATQFIRKAKEIAAETGRDYNEVLNELYQTEIYRKKADPGEAALKDEALDVASIIESTKDARGTPKLDKFQTEFLVSNLKELEKADPKAYNKFIGTRATDKYIFGREEYDTNTGEIKSNSIIADYPENTYFYDVERGKFIYRQGNRVLELDFTIQE